MNLCSLHMNTGDRIERNSRKEIAAFGFSEDTLDLIRMDGFGTALQEFVEPFFGMQVPFRSFHMSEVTEWYQSVGFNF